MRYQIVLDAQPERFLRKAPRDVALRLLKTFDRLFAHEPVPHDAKRVQGQHGVYRVRVGAYRALYRVQYEKELIILVHLERREQAY